MARISLTFLFFFNLFAVLAQSTGPTAKGNGRISGIVLDSASRKPVEFVTISLFPSGSSKVVDGNITNSKGYFIISGIASGSYDLTFSFIGYRTRARRGIVISETSSAANIGTVLLSSNAKALKGVTVTAERDIIENRVDKLVYNAEKDVSAIGGMATDILRKVPQVTVDLDGNLELRGSANVKVLIDGKPSTIMATSVADALQAIPASQIKSVEVITSPSAKYDAEGTAGIINIILKKNRARGVNGAVTVGPSTHFNNGNANINIRNGTFGINASAGGDLLLPSNSYAFISRNSTGPFPGDISSLNENQTSKVHRNSYNAQVGFDWDITPKINLTSSVRVNNFGFYTKGTTTQDSLATFHANVMMDTGALNTANVFTSRLSDNHFRVKGIDWTSDFKKTFAKDGQELDISYVLSYNRNINYFATSQVHTDNHFTPIATPFSDQNSYNLGTNRESTLQIDYTQPFTKTIKMEIGNRDVFRNITSNFYGTSFSINDTALDGNFRYRQNVYAAYVTLSFKLFNAFDFYLGGRYERTDNKVFFSYLPSTTVPSYNTYIPTATIAKTLKHYQTIKLSYTRRIQRPSIRNLNPFKNASDPTNISEGNPDLRPELTHSVELSYSTFFKKGSSLNTALYYRYTTSDIESYQLSLNGSSSINPVFVTTFENTGVQRVAGLSIFGSVPFTPKLTVRGNLNGFRNNLAGTGIYDFYKNTNFSYNVNLNASYQFTPTVSAEFFGLFNSSRKTIQGSNPSFSLYNMGVKKQFWNKKGSLTLNTTTPFQPYTYLTSRLNGSGNGTNFNYVNERKIVLRSVGLTFNYQFGKINYTKTKSERSIDPELKEGEDNSGVGIGGGGGAPGGGGGGRQGSGQPGGGQGGGRPAGTGRPTGGYPGSGNPNRGNAPADSGRVRPPADSLQRTRPRDSTLHGPRAAKRVLGALDRYLPAFASSLYSLINFPASSSPNARAFRSAFIDSSVFFKACKMMPF